MAFHWRSEGGTRICGAFLPPGARQNSLTKGEGRLFSMVVGLDGKLSISSVTAIGLNYVWSVSLASGEERPRPRSPEGAAVSGPWGLAIDASVHVLHLGRSRADIWVADLVQPPDK
jgi:hypothetical protein